VTARQAVECVERERARAEIARHALAARAEPLTRVVGRVDPLILMGSALAAGLVAGRLFGRPTLPPALAPAALVASALQKTIVGLLETLFSAALTPTPRPRPETDRP